MAAKTAGPLSADERRCLDKAHKKLDDFVMEERARFASGQLGVVISIRNGALEIKEPKRYLIAS